MADEITDAIETLSTRINELGDYGADGSYLVYQSIADVASAEQLVEMEHPMADTEQSGAIGMLLIAAILYAHSNDLESAEIAEAVEQSLTEIETHIENINTTQTDE